ncbi:MAG TPA: amidohydrolase family protein [Acidimicrobiia bacterium]
MRFHRTEHALAPPLLAARSSDEYRPPPLTKGQRRAAVGAMAAATRHASRVGLEAAEYLAGRLGTAATLRALDAAAGGGFFAVPPEAELDEDAADAAFASGPLVVDVQTHLVRPSRRASAGADALFAYLRMVDPDRWGGGVDANRLSAAEWAACVFGGSDTAVALLTSPPGRSDENVLTNEDIANAKAIVERYAGTRRVLTHTIVHPNLGPAELDAMTGWRDALGPAGWKVYTLWAPPGPGGGWSLDDEDVGAPFLERVRALGPRIVCAHKGIAGPVANRAPASASPRDVGPAAAAFPDVTFVVYHSGYDINPVEEGPHRADRHRGVSRLVTSLADAGVPPGANVYAELGSTWYLMMRRPTEAAHVLGKLLVAVGDERILWGTDSVWYGAPQPLIDAFRAFRIPERMQEEFGYPALTDTVKAKILGLNAARLYDVDAAAARDAMPQREWLTEARAELGRRLS